MPTDASDRVKRLAFKLDVHTLKELALALGIETVQSTRRKLTKDDLAKAIWRRADYMRERVNLAKFEQDELRSEVSALKEQVWELQVSSMIDNDGPDDSDGETLYHCDIAAALEAAGEAGTPAAPTWTRGASTTHFGITSDELVSLTVKTMWQDFAELELHPRDEVRELQVNVRELFGFESYGDVVLYADGKQMHPLRRIEDYFAVGTSGTILVGCMLEGGGRAEKRNRSDTSSLGGGVGSGSVLTLDAFDSEEDEGQDMTAMSTSVGDKLALYSKKFMKHLALAKSGLEAVSNGFAVMKNAVALCEVSFSRDPSNAFLKVLQELPVEQAKRLSRANLPSTRNPGYIASALCKQYVFAEVQAKLEAIAAATQNMERLQVSAVQLGYASRYLSSKNKYDHDRFETEVLDVIQRGGVQGGTFMQRFFRG
jgi:hypothetical protein